MTQAALSRQVKRLEEDLGTPLCVRSHRRVELTPEGRRLARLATEPFERVAEVGPSEGRSRTTW